MSPGSPIGYFYSHQISSLPIILQASVIWLHVPEISICSIRKIKLVEEKVGSFQPCLVFGCKWTMRRFFYRKHTYFSLVVGTIWWNLHTNIFSYTYCNTAESIYKTQYIFVQENYRLIESWILKVVLFIRRNRWLAGACWVFEMNVLYYNVTLQFFFLDESFVSGMIEAERFPVLLSEKKS